MVFEKVCKILADQFGVAENSLNMDTAFIEDLGADSLDDEYRRRVRHR